MPRTIAKTSNVLSIRLEAPNPLFSAGDTLIGVVARKHGLVSPHATVKIQLHGRSKSHLVVSNGQTSATYRGRCNYFDPHEMTQTIHEGPLHIPNDDETTEWPFAVTIPTHISPLALNPRTNDADMCFLPLDPETVASTALPPTFYARDIGFFSQKHHSFVEYWLHAELRYTREGHFESKEADLPLHIRAATASPVDPSSHLKTSKTLRVVASHRLVPGMETAELSFHQKTRKLFGSSKLPRFAYSLQVDYPTVIQLGSPRAIPFYVKAVPDWGRTSEDIANVPQQVKLVDIEMGIHSTTAIRCVGTFSAKKADDTEKKPLQLRGPLSRLEKPVLIPCGDAVAPCDFGALLDLRLDACGHQVGFREPHCPMGTFHPSFTTWNIRHSHQLKWRVRMNVADEDVGYEMTAPLIILAPSYGPAAEPSWVRPPADETWIQPPTDGEAPPAFDQIEKEGEIVVAMASIIDGKGRETVTMGQKG
ncbi:hypothetical protein BN1723_010782, partial [Verticillium longisporum]